MFVVYKHAPNSSFMALFLARFAPEADRAYQLPFGKGAHHIVFDAGG